MEAKRKRNNFIILLLLLVLAAGMAAVPKLMRRETVETGDTSSILSARVKRGSIRTTITGGGTLTDGEGTVISAPHGVEITEFLVNNGDMVEAGQPIAAVDMLSVQTTLQTLQKNLDYIARQMKLNPRRVGSSYIKAVNAGRVKAVYAKAEDQVTEVISRYGALAVVSLDGLMALQLETTSDVRPAENVTVRLPDGTEKPGRVERRLNDTLTVTLTDDGPKIGDQAEVYSAAGERLGSGTLYVHSAWNVTAASGKVAAVSAREGLVANAGSVLFALRDVELNSEYTKFYEQHLEYEEAMLRLYEIYRSGAIVAETAGRVSGIETTKIGPVLEGGGDYVLTLLDNGNPPPDPRRDPTKNFTNRYAQVGTIKFGSITFYVQKDKSGVGRYSDTPSVNLEKCRGVVLKSFAGIVIYDYDQETKKWKEISPDELEQEDVLWFVYGSEDRLQWIMRPPQPEPEVFFSGGGGAYVEPPFEMFELYDVDLAKITPQETVTVEVNIDELDIVSVSEGQTAEITIDALPGRAFDGTVTRIDPNGKNTGGNTRYKVTITIDRDENMLTGMNATAILTVGVTENVLTIPTAALDQRGNKTIVYTGCDPETRALTGEREVVIGVSDGETVEISEGLSEGETVWYSYYETESLPAFSAAGPVETA